MAFDRWPRHRGSTGVGPSSALRWVEYVREKLGETAGSGFRRRVRSPTVCAMWTRTTWSYGLSALVALLSFSSPADAERVSIGGSIAVTGRDRLPVARPIQEAFEGKLTLARHPAPGWTVDLYEAGRNGATPLASTTTDDEGGFTFPRSSQSSASVLYVVAHRDPDARMLALLGRGAEAPSSFYVNEHTTIASIWAAAQFLEGTMIAGNEVGLDAAARNVPNLVNLSDGELGEVIQNDVNGTRTNSLATFNTLASLLSDCLRSGCPDFYALATPPGGTPPTDTLGAFGNVARNPWNNVVAIFEQRPPASAEILRGRPAFLPTLLFAPTAWTLSIVHTRGGFQAPGGISIDPWGNVWTNNNFMPGSQSILFPDGFTGVHSYDGIAATKLRSDGSPVSPPAGFVGGGTFGGAFGVAIDKRGHAWIGNAAGNSLSEFTPDGTPISPDSVPQYAPNGGWRTTPELDFPQSIVFTENGDLWVTNLMGDTVTQLIGGDPTNTRTWGGPECEHQFRTPWGLASDAEGRVWVSNFASNRASRIDPSQATTPPFCPEMNYRLGADGVLEQPEGIAVDSRGNVWVAKLLGGQVALLEKSRGFQPPQDFDGAGSAKSPWGIAVDGADNVWVANFLTRRIVHLCGLGGNCPQGVSPGDPISPPGEDGGYGANGSLQSLTAVKIDQAGNVWVANNFQSTDVCLNGAGLPPPDGATTTTQERLQTQCGGNGVVQVLGVAAPTEAPVVGPASPPLPY